MRMWLREEENFKLKKKREGGRQNGVGEGNVKIWDLKYKNSEHLWIKLRKCYNNHHINKQRAKINKGGKRIRIL